MTVSKGEDEGKLSEVLAALSACVAPEAKPATVLFLGRYRFVEPDLRVLKRRFPRLKIRFKTIHASKGLEADHVILLNADSGRNGFPSEIVDDPLLSLVSPEEEAFQNAEERRVMYVAMTRAAPDTDNSCLERPAVVFRDRASERPRLWDFDSPRG